LVVVTAAILVLLGLAGCGSDAQEQETPGDGGTTSSIDITIEGDSVSPNGERVQVAAGVPLELVVTADAPGTLHVHSSPEQELSYEEGTTTLELTVDQPGIVDVESHELGKVIVQLEVR
jgi:hypothetical protein